MDNIINYHFKNQDNNPTLNLERLLLRKDRNLEETSFCLIQEIEHSFELNKLTETYHNRRALVDCCILDDSVPEEYAQRLLRLKILSLMIEKKYNKALSDLNVVLDNEDNRLFCATSAFYKLLFLKADVLIAIEEFQCAYEFLQKINIDYFNNDSISDFSDCRELRRDLIVKTAVAAHFNNDNDSYNFFQKILTESIDIAVLDFNIKNKQIFMIYAGECFRQKKHNEAASVFRKLFEISRDNPNLIELEFFQEATAMAIVAKIRNGQFDVQEEYNCFLSLFSDSSAHLSLVQQFLKKQVSDLISYIYPKLKGASLVISAISETKVYSPSYDIQAPPEAGLTAQAGAGVGALINAFNF